MLRWLKYIRLVRQIDGLCFSEKAGIKFTLFGEPGYDPKARILGFSAGKRYLLPIFPLPRVFFRPHSMLQIAIHEVRHRIQWERVDSCLWNLPNEATVSIREMIVESANKAYLYSVDDLPKTMHTDLVLDVGGRCLKMSPRELDAEIVERLALPLFKSNQISAFLKLMFGKAKSETE